MKDRMPATKGAEGPYKLLAVIAVVLLIIDMVLIAAERYASGQVLLPELIGALLSPIIFTIVVVAIARLFKRARDKRGTAKVAVGTLAIVAMGSCATLAASATDDTGAKHPAAQLAKISAEVAGKGLPTQIDSVTQLLKVSATGDTLTSEFRVNNVTASELDASALDAFRAQLIDHDCRNAGLRSRFLSQGVVIRYRYQDAADAPLTSVDLTEAVCKAVK